MASTSEKSTPRKKKRKPQHIEQFVNSDDETMRDAYRTYVDRIARVSLQARAVLDDSSVTVRSELWQIAMAPINAMHDALIGWAPERAARVMLIECIDDAVNHTSREKRHLELKASLVAREVSNEQLERTLLVDRYKNFRTAGAAFLFRQLSENRDPEREPVLFAAFLFRDRCPAFACHLRTQAAMSALTTAVAAWARPASTHGLAKWDALEILLIAIDLSGIDAEGLRSEWRAWRRKRGLL